MYFTIMVKQKLHFQILNVKKKLIKLILTHSKIIFFLDLKALINKFLNVL